MRLAPIDAPSSWLGRLLSFAMRRQLGRVLTPARVVYNRVPRMWNVSWALIRLDLHGIRLPTELVLLLQTRVALLNGCDFCADIAMARAVQDELGLERFRALPQWRTSPLFDAAERAALAYVEEASLHKNVSDEVFEELQKHYGEREIVEITVMNAVENFYNLLNLPLRIPDDGLLATAQARAKA